MIRWLDVLRLRVRSLIRRAEADATLRKEIDLHLADQIDEYRAEGFTEAEARAKALRDFGPVAAVEDACRDARRVSFLANLVEDLRHSRRSLMRQPLLVLAAVTSIGIAIAANTAVFALASDLLLSPPSVRDSGAVVRVRLDGNSHASYLRWLTLKDRGVFEGLAGYRIETEVNWRRGEETTSLLPMIVTANFFDVLGVPVAQGRGFTATEADAERAPKVVVVSDAFWRLSLDADPDVIGRTLTFNGRPYVIVGVLPRASRSLPGYGLSPEVYLPISRELIPSIGGEQDASVELVGRLKDGQSRLQGEAALTSILEEEKAEGPGRPSARVYSVSGPGRIGEVDAALPFFVLLGVASALVLTIACANVAGLLLARGVVRRREIAVRSALGAGRARLVQQMLVDGLWLAFAGTVAGVALMFGLITLISRIPFPLPMPVEFNVALDLPMLAVSVLLVASTTLLCGLVPAWRATRPDLAPSLKNDDLPRTRRRFTLQRTLVTGQVAFAAMLLVTAFLFLRNLTRATEADPGFEVERTIVARVSLVDGGHIAEVKNTFSAGAVESLSALPGVERVSYAQGMPLTLRSGMTTGAELRVAESGASFFARYEVNFVGPAYFAALGIPVVKGRELNALDRTGAPVAIVVNERFAQLHFKDAEPVGRHLLLPGPNNQPYSAEIVGVVGNSKHRTIGETQQAAIYEAFLQRSRRDRSVHIVMRANAAPAALIPQVRERLTLLDPTAAVEVMEMRSALAFAFLPSRIGAALLGLLGALGLTLAAVGLFAVMSFTVTRCTAEIGVRMTLGASRAAVLRLVLGDALAVVGMGLALGMGSALFVTRPLAMFLVHGLSPSDPSAIVSTGVAMLAVGITAAWWPARRAAGIDPARTLRTE